MSEELYQYFLDSNDADEGLATVQALKALIAKYAGAMREKVGDVEVWMQQAYDGYSELLDKYLKDPSFSVLGAITPYAGGLSFSEKRSDYCDTDLRNNPFTEGSVKRRPTQGYYAEFHKGNSGYNTND